MVILLYSPKILVAAGGGAVEVIVRNKIKEKSSWSLYYSHPYGYDRHHQKEQTLQE